MRCVGLDAPTLATLPGRGSLPAFWPSMASSASAASASCSVSNWPMDLMLGWRTPISSTAGLIVNAVNPSTIRLIPPLTVSDAEVDEAVALINTALLAQMSAS